MTLDLGNIQFYWRMITDNEKEKVDIPAFLPFEFKFNNKLQLIQQNISVDIWNKLEQVYQYDYNVGYLQDGHDLAEGYATDFLNFFVRSTQNKAISTIFEIGCGGGYLLKRIKEIGNFKVTCLDPSPVAARNRDCFEVISTFYPSKEYTNKVDLIIHYDVLEHIEDPVQFLNAHKTNLNNQGFILFAVPDCTNYIKIGDVSMVLHEHINYFDQESLYLTVLNAGFQNIIIENSNHGGVLYCFAQYNDEIIKEAGIKENSNKFLNFKNKYTEIQQSISGLVDSAKRGNKSIGFYVPLRALPYISEHNDFHFRFFDDDSGIHGKFFDGFTTPIENFNDLKKSPVDILIIMSDSFGQRIKEKILKEKIAVNIILIGELSE